MIKGLDYLDSAKFEKKFPKDLKVKNINDNKLYIMVLVRLLLGQIKIQYRYNKFCYSGKIDYSILPFKNYQEDEKYIITESSINLIFDPSYDGSGKIKFRKKLINFLNNQRVNTNVIVPILDEISLALLFFENGNYSSSFIHFYRATENMTYLFPFIYVSQQTSYKGTYDALKDFFTKDNELKMYQVLEDKIFAGEVTQDLDMDLKFNVGYEEMDYLINKVFCSTYFPKIPFDYDNNLGLIKCKFRNMFNFIISLRNKTFHMLEGTQRAYIPCDKVDFEEIYAGVLPACFNWFTSVYFKILSKIFEITD